MIGTDPNPRLQRLKGLFVAGVLVAGLAGCARPAVQPPPAPVPETPYVELYPLTLGDDLETVGLGDALLSSREYFRRPGIDRRLYEFGDRRLSTEDVARSVERFIELAEADDASWLSAVAAADCRMFGRREVQFTAYFEPELEARLVRDETFRYPLYSLPGPQDLERLGVEAADLTRARIDGEGALDGSGLEIAWLDDPVKRFFLHIQGSGVLRFGDGSVRRVGYAGTNGLAYTSVGRLMLDRGLLGPGEASAVGIRAALTADPEGRDELMFANERYIYFALSDAGAAVGSLGVPLVAGRSLAADPDFLPSGAVVYLETDKPVLDEDGGFVGWEPAARFGLVHDAGAAIRGPGRIDIFWGTGTDAGVAAGYVNRPGSLYVLDCDEAPGEDD